MSETKERIETEPGKVADSMLAFIADYVQWSKENFNENDFYENPAFKNRVEEFLLLSEDDKYWHIRNSLFDIFSILELFVCADRKEYQSSINLARN